MSSSDILPVRHLLFPTHPQAALRTFLLSLLTFSTLLLTLYGEQTTVPSTTRIRTSLPSLLLPTQDIQLQIPTRERRMLRRNLLGRRERSRLLLKEGRRSLEQPTEPRGFVPSLFLSRSVVVSTTFLLSRADLSSSSPSLFIAAILSSLSTTSLANLASSHSHQLERSLWRSNLSSWIVVLSTQQPPPLNYRPSSTSHVPTSTPNSAPAAATRSIRPVESATAADLATAARLWNPAGKLWWRSFRRRWRNWRRRSLGERSWCGKYWR